MLCGNHMSKKLVQAFGLAVAAGVLITLVKKGRGTKGPGRQTRCPPGKQRRLSVVQLREAKRAEEQWAKRRQAWFTGSEFVVRTCDNCGRSVTRRKGTGAVHPRPMTARDLISRGRLFWDWHGGLIEAVDAVDQLGSTMCRLCRKEAREREIRVDPRWAVDDWFDDTVFQRH